MRIFWGFRNFAAKYRGWLPALAVLVVLAVVGPVPGAQADSLQELIEQVGTDYAEAYTSPFIQAFGPNQNTNLFATANIPFGNLTIGFGVKVMGTYLNESDQTFQKVVDIPDLGDIDPSLAGQSGTAVMSGPTIFGDTETDGQIDLYANGVLVGTFDGIPGFWNSRWAPLATPEVFVGGLFGFKATLRYFPPVGLGDLGKTSYVGYGLQWSASSVWKDPPVDLMIGFFLTSLDVENTQNLGQDNLIDSSADSYFLGASKSWAIFTLYGGFALESSDMTVTYYYQDPDYPTLDSNVNFSVEGNQSSRFTLGVDVDVLVHVNLEAGFGDLSTYSAGVMFVF